MAKPHPNSSMLLELMAIIRQYDPDDSVRLLITLAASLIATSRDPEKKLKAAQDQLAKQMHQTIDRLPETIEYLDQAKAELTGAKTRDRA